MNSIQDLPNNKDSNPISAPLIVTIGSLSNCEIFPLDPNDHFVDSLFKSSVDVDNFTDSDHDGYIDSIDPDRCKIDPAKIDSDSDGYTDAVDSTPNKTNRPK